MGALDLPSEPDEPGRAEHVRDRDADQPKARDMPNPDERGRAYEAIRAHVSATRDEAGPDRSSGGYWDEVPGFLTRAAAYRERWLAERQTAPDSSADPPGSFRSCGGFYLSPERHAEVVAAIGRVRETETDSPTRACVKISAGRLLPRSSSGNTATSGKSWSRSATSRLRRSSGISASGGGRTGSRWTPERRQGRRPIPGLPPWADSAPYRAGLLVTERRTRSAMRLAYCVVSYWNAYLMASGISRSHGPPPEPDG